MAKRGRPRVIATRCVADQYAVDGQRIIEFSFKDGTGGLISLVEPRKDEDPARLGSVYVYRTDGKVTVESDAPAPKRSYWALWVRRSGGYEAEQSIHTSERAALQACADALEVSKTEEGEVPRYLDDVELQAVLDQAMNEDDKGEWDISEVTTP